MKIKWKEFEKVKVKDLKGLIEDACVSYDSSELDNVVDKINILASFNIKTVELLYKKGLLTDEDVKSLISSFMHVECDIEILD